jgi:two-component system KDP operon response regulator KdpE
MTTLPDTATPCDHAATVCRVPQLLLVEDDSAIRSALVRALSDRGHGVDTAPTGMEGLHSALEGEPDLILLDLGLPDVDGATLLKMLRGVSQVPVVVITAQDDEGQIIRALDAGADDYVVKPFSADHLDARIRAVLRRTSTPDIVGPLVVGGLTVDPQTRDATLDGKTLDLSRKEFDLLHQLARKAGQVVTKRDLLAEVWHLPYGGAEKTVDVHLSWLRRKLGESAQEPRYLHSVRGVGIKLVPPPP